jgi:hypothetical protein
MGPTFWKLQKCGTFRPRHRYQMHFAWVVAFSFCSQNGAPTEKGKMKGLMEAVIATTNAWCGFFQKPLQLPPLSSAPKHW